MNIEGLALDHLRVFLAVVEEGSFSETARRFGRAQSAVSRTISTLERQLGVELFARSNYRPTLTDTGTALLPHAVEVVAQADRLKSHANALSGGLEPELSIAVDCAYPISSLSRLLRDLHFAYPTVGAKVQVEALGGVAELVLNGSCSIGIVATLPFITPALQGYALDGIQTLPVASPDHPLTRLDDPADSLTLREHVQIVLTDRTDLTKGRDFGVLSSNTWRVSALGAKHELLRAGLGWGSMPLHLVEEDLACNRLKTLAIDSLPSQGEVLPVNVVHRADAILGPVARWSIQRLRSTRSGLLRS